MTIATRSTDHRLPLWLRVTALAVEEAVLDDLGQPVARFARNEVRELLAQDYELESTHVARAIRIAEAHGLLARGSSTRCLRVIPGSLTTGPGR